MNLTASSVLYESPQFHTGFIPKHESINTEIIQYYHAIREDEFRKRSHHFNGRYENLYIHHDQIPVMEKVMIQATILASQILQLPAEKLRSGYWINDMGPGESTSEHNHDDDDELLSGVYYVKVPENSGNLIIVDRFSHTEVKSQEGMFVFFAPSVLHSVSKNLSQERRISIGMNFGPA